MLTIWLGYVKLGSDLNCVNSLVNSYSFLIILNFVKSYLNRSLCAAVHDAYQMSSNVGLFWAYFGNLMPILSDFGRILEI